MKTRNPIRMTTLAIAIAGSATITSAEEPRLYETHVIPDSLMFEPVSEQAMTSKIDLIIKGPGNFYLRRSFAPGALIEIDPLKLAGGHLPDGTYVYETRVMGTANGPVQRGEGAEINVAEQPAASSGAFSVKNGQLVTPKSEPPPARDKHAASVKSSSASGPQASNEQTIQAQVVSDDQIVQGSLCVGFDCGTTESFGFDTIRMKENNLRIKFDDTSTSGSFPNNDWQLTANDSANGGLNKFSIENTTAGRIPFTVEGSAPTNSLWIDDTGRIGFGTSTPVVENHIVDGDTPTVRLEQDGSSGFAAQTWDIAGNETNFFVRDVTNGSLLPFKIRPGAATDSLVIDAQGDVAIGVANADSKLHVRGTNGSTSAKIEEASGTLADRQMLTLTNNGGSRIDFLNTNSGEDWRFANEHTSDSVIITKIGTGNIELRIENNGDVAIAGSLSQGSSRAIKTAIQRLDGLTLLENLTRLDFSEWSYKDRPKSRHIGPMAEDFHDAFGLGTSDKHIAPGDMAGIAMAASKELALRNQELKARVQKLEEDLQRMETLEGELAEMRQILSTLRK